MARPIPSRGYIAYAHDIFMAGLSFVLSLYLRIGDDLEFYPTDFIIYGTLTFTAVAAMVFWVSGLYRGVWRYASMNDLLAITKAASLTVLLFLVVLFLWTRLEDLPRSVLLINWFILMALIGGPRFVYRLLKDRRLDLHLEKDGHRRIPVLLVGAGDGAELFIRSINRSADSNYRVVGILSEKENRVGRHIHGVEVLGTMEDLSSVISNLKGTDVRPEKLVLSKENIDGARVRNLLDAGSKHGISVARLPKLTDLKAGLADKLEIKPIAIEDLLGRPQTPLDREAMKNLVAGRRVLVTGAGGSIGSELVRQVAALGPSTLTLLDSGEFNLYAIDLEIANSHPDLARTAVIADVRDKDRLSQVFNDAKPELVFHAAALKHVPLVEDNILEGLMTNVIGSANVADVARDYGVLTVVQISTDKAVNPTNIMGASKRIAEQYAQGLDVFDNDSKTRFVTVRFGNVLGSTGSVVPLFQKQLAAGGPLTVTHEDMTRYFMTIHEAVELVLQASALGIATKDQAGKIFVLDMGEPVKIMDLAKQMIRLAGLTPDKDIKIDVTGLRPGEKLFEEIFHGSEELVPTACAGILLAAPRAADLDRLKQALTDIRNAAETGSVDKAKAIVKDLVPEYQPNN